MKGCCVKCLMVRMTFRIALILRAIVGDFHRTAEFFRAIFRLQETGKRWNGQNMTNGCYGR